MWQPLRKSHKTQDTDPKAKINFLLSIGCTNLSSVRKVIQTEEQGILTALEPSGFLPWQVPDAFHPISMMLTDKLYVLSHRSNEEEDILSPSAPHKETRWRFCPAPLGNPAAFPWIAAFTKCEVVIQDYKSECLIQLEFFEFSDWVPGNAQLTMILPLQKQ